KALPLDLHCGSESAETYENLIKINPTSFILGAVLGGLVIFTTAADSPNPTAWSYHVEYDALILNSPAHYSQYLNKVATNVGPANKLIAAAHFPRRRPEEQTRHILAVAILHQVVELAQHVWTAQIVVVSQIPGDFGPLGLARLRLLPAQRQQLR